MELNQETPRFKNPKIFNYFTKNLEEKLLQNKIGFEAYWYNRGLNRKRGKLTFI